MSPLQSKVMKILSKSRTFYKKSKNTELQYQVTKITPEKVTLKFLSNRTIRISLVTFIRCFDKKIFYFDSKTNEKVCSCGAKHTSTPNFHLSYCDYSL